MGSVAMAKKKELERRGFISMTVQDKNNCLVCSGCNSCSDGGGGGDGNGGD
jgi:hypothetical protein